MRAFHRFHVPLIVAAFCLIPIAVARAAPQKKALPMNVLFIAVDDLRPEIGAYGHPVVKTPNMDRLAREGTVFHRAYTHVAVCNPSRVAVMTGLRPDTTKIYDLQTHFRDTTPDALTVGQHFKKNGYYTEHVGKIFHQGNGGRPDPDTWTVNREHPTAPRWGPDGMMIAAAQEKTKTGRRGPAWEVARVGDDDLHDGMTAINAIKIMEEVKDRPFFLGVGFLNPHLPFVAPKKYWDLYAEGDIRLAPNPYPPRGAPDYAATGWGELRAYADIPEKGPLSEEQARKMVHGYWAATSYVDALVGRLMDALERLGLRDRTAIVLWGDHGWHLGEHGFWCKHTNYDIAARSALIMSVPGQKVKGRGTKALVEFVDLFPTLVDVTGLPMPLDLEGISARPLLDNPGRRWKSAAFHQYPRYVPQVGHGMGRAMRTQRYHLIEWTVPEKNFVEHELYDLEKDPDENRNLAICPDQDRLLKQLARQLHAGWEAALPPGISRPRASKSAE